jgi:hypothetical protein
MVVEVDQPILDGAAWSIHPTGTEGSEVHYHTYHRQNDSQAKADTCVVGGYACGAAKKTARQAWKLTVGELLAGVLDSEQPLACEYE